MKRLPSSTDRERAATLKQSAESALEQNDRDGARGYLELVVEADPLEDDASILLAKLALDAGDHGEAVRRATESLSVRPFHPPGWVLLGTALESLGDAAAARRVFARARRQSPAFRARPSERGSRKRGPGGAAGKRAPRLRSARLAVAVIAAEPGAPIDPTLESLGDLPGQVRVITTGFPTPTFECSIEDVAVGDVHHGGDLASAATLALAGCSAEWVLLLYAGERLEASTRREITIALRSRALCATLAVGDGPHEARLFRNAPRLRFEGFARPDPRRRLFELTDAWRLPVATLGRRAAVTPSPAVPAVDAGLEAAWWFERLRVEQDDWLASLHVARDGAEESAGSAVDTANKAIDRLLSSSAGRHPLFLEPAAAAAARLVRDGHSGALDALVRSGEILEDARWIAAAATGALLADGRAEEARALLDTTGPEQGTTVSYLPAGPSTDDRAARLRLADAELHVGQLPRAHERLNAILADDPACLDAHVARLGVLLLLTESEAVATALEQVAATFPRDPDAWRRIGRVIDRIPELIELSTYWYDEAVSRFPGDSEIVASRDAARERMSTTAAPRG